jgi:hypothetical protein
LLNVYLRNMRCKHCKLEIELWDDSDRQADRWSLTDTSFDGLEIGYRHYYYCGNREGNLHEPLTESEQAEILLKKYEETENP